MKKSNKYPYRIKKLVTLNWAIYCNSESDSSIIWIETNRKRASHLASKLNQAFELGKETEWKESQAKAEKLMERFGI